MSGSFMGSGMEGVITSAKPSSMSPTVRSESSLIIDGKYSNYINTSECSIHVIL